MKTILNKEIIQRIAESRSQKLQKYGFESEVNGVMGNRFSITVLNADYRKLLELIEKDNEFTSLIEVSKGKIVIVNFHVQEFSGVYDYNKNNL